MKGGLYAYLQNGEGAFIWRFTDGARRTAWVNQGKGRAEIPPSHPFVARCMADPTLSRQLRCGLPAHVPEP